MNNAANFSKTNYSKIFILREMDIFRSNKENDYQQIEIIQQKTASKYRPKLLKTTCCRTVAFR